MSDAGTLLSEIAERHAFYAGARDRFRQRLQILGAADAFRAAQTACGCDGCECALPAVEGAALDIAETRVAGVRFRDSGKTYYVDPIGYELEPGQHVVMDTARGLELAQVVIAPRQVVSATIDGDLKPIQRIASDHDLSSAERRRSEHGEAVRVFAQKIRDHGLPMKPVSADFAFDGARLTLYFSANGRVDFRELVRDLARHFNCRIELRQIGPRDEARLLGGLGRCGRPLCCSTWLPQFADVSMTMAKTQELSFNPDKVSGVCGKLLCCLSYENDMYVESRKVMPRLGQDVMTERGPGYVHAMQILNESVVIRLVAGDDITVPATALTYVQAAADNHRRRRPRRDTATTTELAQ